MCLLCLEIAKSKMTVKEARRALPEMIDTTKDAQDKRHYQELQNATDEQLEKQARQYAEKSRTNG